MLGLHTQDFSFFIPSIKTWPPCLYKRGTMKKPWSGTLRYSFMLYLCFQCALCPTGWLNFWGLHSQVDSNEIKDIFIPINDTYLPSPCCTLVQGLGIWNLYVYLIYIRWEWHPLRNLISHNSIIWIYCTVVWIFIEWFSRQWRLMNQRLQYGIR